MSATKEGWDRVKREIHGEQSEDIESLYAEMFGPLYYKGLDIGRQVTAKLKPKDCRWNEAETSKPWSTLLQAEGLDSGLSAGFLSVCGVCVLGEGNPLNDVKEAIELQYDTTVTLERIETHNQLVADYPDYATIPDEQMWTLPGVMVHYAT